MKARCKDCFQFSVEEIAVGRASDPAFFFLDFFLQFRLNGVRLNLAGGARWVEEGTGCLG